WLRPEVIGADVAALTTEISTPRAEPVRWTLPPTASFTVRAVGPDGGPFVAARMILLERLHGAELPAEGTAPHGAPVGDGRPVRGIARFPYAAPNRAFRAEVRHEAPGALEGSVTFLSPRGAEGDLVVDLPCGRPALTATGRVVDENGAPRVGVAVLVDAESTTSGPGKALTADDGTFRCGLKVAVEPPFPEAYRVDLRESAGSGSWRFRAEPIRDVAPVSGVADLGTIVWRRTPPFCGGRVVGPDGRPVPGATVRFFRDAGAWIPDAPHDGVKTDAQGRFLMPALTPPRPEPESRRAVAAAAKHLASVEPVVFQPGALDVVVGLEPCGDLSGSYRIGGPKAAGVGHVKAEDAVSVVFLGPSAEGSPWLRKVDDEAYVAEFHVPGWVRATHLRPGRLRVEFRRRGFATPLHVVDGVEIRAGEVCRDPRLQDVDLSAALGRVVVTVTDEAGRPLDGAEIHVLGPDGDWRRDAAGSDGRVQADLAGATDVWATAKSRRPRRVRGVTAGMEVRLESALTCTATVRVAGDALPTHDGYELTLALHWSGETLEEAIADRGAARHPLHPAGRWSPPALMKLDGSRTAVFRLSAHGVYEVVAMWSKETTTSLVQTTHKTWLSAPEGAATAETTLTLTAADLERSTPRDR
ncbi:MAG TPA: carboxypeptidase-like regulatory domain-containing protein, partial [Planctomycetota bacterium]|nr:carboxypeptidase-like regulatory domain-containing protein [Planctomycetota bacterium]